MLPGEAGDPDAIVLVIDRSTNTEAGSRGKHDVLDSLSNPAHSRSALLQSSTTPGSMTAGTFAEKVNVLVSPQSIKIADDMHGNPPLHPPNSGLADSKINPSPSSSLKLTRR